MPRHTLLATVAAALLVAGAATAQTSAPSDDERVLPPAQPDVWTAERLTPATPPGIDGAIAQVRGKGEGRFAILCTRGDRQGTLAWRSPPGTRTTLQEMGGTVRVRFVFDDGASQAIRELTWDEAGGYWSGTFGPNSDIAEMMRKRYAVRAAVIDKPGVASEFTLSGSFRAINEMFAICDR